MNIISYLLGKKELGAEPESSSDCKLNLSYYELNEYLHRYGAICSNGDKFEFCKERDVFTYKHAYVVGVGLGIEVLWKDEFIINLDRCSFNLLYVKDKWGDKIYNYLVSDINAIKKELDEKFAIMEENNTKHCKDIRKKLEEAIDESESKVVDDEKINA